MNRNTRTPRTDAPAPGGRRRRARAFLGLAGLICALAGSAAAAEDASRLRLCADPDNLPFSSSDPKTPGLYNEIGSLLGQSLGRPVEPVWALSYFGKRMVRTTMLAKQCDAMIGLPADPGFMGPRVIFSKPLFQVGYALVTPKAVAIDSLAALAGRKVAVQFNSGPQSLLALHDEITSVTVLDPESAMKALAAGEVDAAFIWGPSAGYLAKTRYGGAYRVMPVAGEGLQWPAAVGFDRSQSGLRDAMDQAIAAEGQAIAGLMQKYGVPAEAPHPLANAETQPAARPIRVAETSTGTASDAPAPGAGAAPAAPVEVATAAAGHPDEGHELFNGTCAHCHGPDAVQSERRINLRLLQHRYGDTMDEVFLKTVTHGRPEKGMPNWTGVFTDDQFKDILAYLHTVQTP